MRDLYLRRLTEAISARDKILSHMLFAVLSNSLRNYSKLSGNAPESLLEFLPGICVDHSFHPMSGVIIPWA